MRTNGTRYDKIDTLPSNAIPVREYADSHNMTVGHVYLKYTRFTEGYSNGTKSTIDPGYIIRCWKGMNFVIIN